MPAPTEEKVPAGGGQASFYSGKVEKVGLGAPDCFQTGIREKKTSFAGNDMIYRDLNGYVEALNGDLEIRPFFPSVGYFNRASKDGKSVTVPSEQTATVNPVPTHEQGLRIARRLTREGVHPYDEIEWELRDAVISNEKGEIAFEQRIV